MDQGPDEDEFYPTLPERLTALEGLPVAVAGASDNDRPAMSLFADPEATEERMSRTMGEVLFHVIYVEQAELADVLAAESPSEALPEAAAPDPSPPPTGGIS